jgi:hypothetical protein
MSKTYSCGNEADKLWALSYNNNEFSIFSGAYGFGGKATDGRTNVAWWLRSGQDTDITDAASGIWISDPVGYWGNPGEATFDVSAECGVRPAFQITL